MPVSRFALSTLPLLGLLLGLPGCKDRPSSEVPREALTAVADEEATPPTRAEVAAHPAGSDAVIAESGPPAGSTAPRPAVADTTPPVGPAPLTAAPPHAWDGQPGSDMPAYTAQGPDGAPVSLADLRGQPVLLNFWATWCVPCRLEFPALAALQTRFAREGLRVVGVSLDERLSPEELSAFSAAQGMGYTVWHDAAGAVPTFGVPPVPGNFVFDRQGRLAFSAIGAPPGSLEALTAAVEQVVAAP